MRSLLLLAVAAFYAHAAVVVIPFGSDLVNEGNNVTGTNVIINPYSAPTWALPLAGALWESFALTGAGQVSPPNSATPIAEFWEALALPYANNSGSVTVYADDTVDGYLFNALYPSGIKLWSGVFVSDVHCANAAPSCETGEGLLFDLSPFLTLGPNMIKLQAYQLWNDTFGVMYAGSVESTSDVPEPGTLSFLAAGCLAAAMRKYIRA